MSGADGPLGHILRRVRRPLRLCRRHSAWARFARAWSVIGLVVGFLMVAPAASAVTDPGFIGQWGDRLVRVSPDLVVVARERRLYVYDVARGTVRRQLPLPGRLVAAAGSLERFALVTQRNGVRALQVGPLDDLRDVALPPGSESHVSDVALSPGCITVIAADDDPGWPETYNRSFVRCSDDGGWRRITARNVQTDPGRISWFLRHGDWGDPDVFISGWPVGNFEVVERWFPLFRVDPATARLRSAGRGLVGRVACDDPLRPAPPDCGVFWWARGVWRLSASRWGMWAYGDLRWSDGPTFGRARYWESRDGERWHRVGGRGAGPGQTRMVELWRHRGGLRAIFVQSRDGVRKRFVVGDSRRGGVWRTRPLRVHGVPIDALRVGSVVLLMTTDGLEVRRIGR